LVSYDFSDFFPFPPFKHLDCHVIIRELISSTVLYIFTHGEHANGQDCGGDGGAFLTGKKRRSLRSWPPSSLNVGEDKIYTRESADLEQLISVCGTKEHLNFVRHRDLAHALKWPSLISHRA